MVLVLLYDVFNGIINYQCRIINSISEFTTRAVLNGNTTNQTLILKNYGFQLFNLGLENAERQIISASLGPPEIAKNLSIPVNISFSNEENIENATVYVEVPLNVLSNLNLTRLSTVVYRQVSLFQNSTDIDNIESTVISVISSINTSVTLFIGFLQDQLQNENEDENEDEDSVSLFSILIIIISNLIV